MTRHLKRRLLERALEIVGDRDALAELLDVEPHALELWLTGRATLPERVFVMAMDVVLRDDIARAAQDRRRAPRAPEPVDVTV
jgi:DNA-binding transcriptional regulator YdaS (Cro superfamily)